MLNRSVVVVVVATLLLGPGCKEMEPKRKRSEAAMNLERIAKLVKVAHAADSALPAGTAGPTPSQPCCGVAPHKCPVTTAWAANPIWKKLGFTVNEPS